MNGNMPPRTGPNQRLRMARLERGWTQQDLADRLGTTAVTVKRWERGIQQPNPYFRLRLTALFAMTEDDLGLSSSALSKERDSTHKNDKELDQPTSEEVLSQPEQGASDVQWQEARGSAFLQSPASDSPTFPGRWGSDRFYPVRTIAVAATIIVLLFSGFLWRVSPWWPSASVHTGNAAQRNGPSGTPSTDAFPPSFSPTFDDSMTSAQTQAGWHHGGTHCVFTSQGYVFTNTSVNFCEAERQPFTDVDYEITMTILQGLAAGIIFRASGDQTDLYAYTVDVTGDYLLEMVNVTNNQYAVLGSGVSSWIKLGNGQPNTLGVSARGSSLRLYVNGHLLLPSITDTTFPSGDVGVIVNSYRNSKAGKDVLTVARYTDAKIWVLL